MPSRKTSLHYRYFNLLAFTLALLSIIGSQSVSSGINETIENALKFGENDAKYGQIKLNLRLRYENANTEESTARTAEAFTLRIRGGYLSPKFHGLQGYAEFEVNQDLGINDYNASRNGIMRAKGFDVIQDPQDTELNQLWLSYSGIPDIVAKVGRQRIKIDNARFIGNVGWRQLEQTFDAVLVTNKSLANTIITVGYIDGVKRIFSDSEEMTAPFLNIAYIFEGYGKLTGYAYWLDYNEMSSYVKSNQTYGFRFNGIKNVTDDIKVLYTAEYAYQSDYENNPFTYEEDYYHIIGGISAFGITIKGGMEDLGGEGRTGKRFQTPLATGHAFNGWADVFLATPVHGLRDVYGSATAIFKGVKLMAVYHDFTDDTGNIEYGNEYDFLITKNFGKHYSLLAKYAYYNADTISSDRQKFWIQAGMSF